MTKDELLMLEEKVARLTEEQFQEVLRRLEEEGIRPHREKRSCYIRGGDTVESCIYYLTVIAGAATLAVNIMRFVQWVDSHGRHGKR